MYAPSVMLSLQYKEDDELIKNELKQVNIVYLAE